MNKKDIADQLAEQAGITKVLSHDLINTVFGLITDALLSGEKVVISDFGSFSVSKRKGFTGINPRTGDPLRVPERRIPVFRGGKGLKESLNMKE